MRQMNVAVRLEDGHAAFAFEEPTNFATLVVTTGTGEELWELHPRGMKAVDGVSGRFLVSPIRREEEANAFDLLERIAANASDESTSVDRVVYGEPPEGYEEVAPAKPLVPGAQYRVVVLKVPEFAMLDFVA